MKLIFLIIILLNFTSCFKKNKSGEKSQSPKMNNSLFDNIDSLNKLLNQAIEKGDQTVYNEVASYYFLRSMNEKFLYYALKMANKNNTPQAYYNVYYILSTPKTGEKLNEMDKKTKDFALYHLLKSYELGYEKAKFRVEEIFGENAKIPNSKDFAFLQ